MGDENKGYLKWRTTLALCHPLGARSTPVEGSLQNEPKKERGLEPKRVSKPRSLLYS